MGQKHAASVRIITDAKGNSRQKCDRRGFECVLKQHREIKLVLSPLARLIPSSPQARAIVNQNFVDKISVKKDVGRSRL